MTNPVNSYFSLIKFSHTIFALPFAIVGFFAAIYTQDIHFAWQQDWLKFVFMLLCMVLARSSAMAFNRYIDRNIDAKNPRTAIREIPSGTLKAYNVLLFAIITAIGFIISTYFINSTCFALSPVAIAIIWGYSLTKRFTFICHFILGIGLSLAPLGAYLVLTERFDSLPLLLSSLVLLWVTGFDIIYALQDEEFDAQNKLYSIPAYFGANKAVFIARMLHAFVASIIIVIGYLYSFHFVYWIGAILFIGLLINQHRILNANDLSKINLAFFTNNGIASFVFAVTTCADLVLFSIH